MTQKGHLRGVNKNWEKKVLNIFLLLKKYMPNFNNIPTELSSKFFDILMRPILTYNSEVWFMDTYLPVYRALNRVEKSNRICVVCSWLVCFGDGKLSP